MPVNLIYDKEHDLGTCDYCLSGDWVHCPSNGYPRAHVSVAKPDGANHKVLILHRFKDYKSPKEHLWWVKQVNEGAHLESNSFGFGYGMTWESAIVWDRSEAEAAVLRRKSRWPFENFTLVVLPNDLDMLPVNELEDHGVL